MEVMTLGIKRDNIHTFRGHWAIRRVRVKMRRLIAKVTPHHTIVAVKPWRARKVATERRSSSHIR